MLVLVLEPAAELAQVQADPEGASDFGLDVEQEGCLRPLASEGTMAVLQVLWALPLQGRPQGVMLQLCATTAAGLGRQKLRRARNSWPQPLHCAFVPKQAAPCSYLQMALVPERELTRMQVPQPQLVWPPRQLYLQYCERMCSVGMLKGMQQPSSLLVGAYCVQPQLRACCRCAEAAMDVLEVHLEGLLLVTML